MLAFLYHNDVGKSCGVGDLSNELDFELCCYILVDSGPTFLFELSLPLGHRFDVWKDG